MLFSFITATGTSIVEPVIGLALVKELSESLGGLVKVESQLGVGSKFSVTLPVEYPGAETIDFTPLALASRAGPPDDEWLVSLYRRADLFIDAEAPPLDIDHVELARRKRPLVIIGEDQPDMAAFIAAQLKDEFDLLIAADGQYAIDMTRQYKPDLLVLDLMMPEKDGLEVCRELESEVKARGLPILVLPDRSGIEALRAIRKIDLIVPIVILTGYSTRSAAENSLRLGATDYINKPFNAHELSRKIERLVLASSIRERTQQLEHSIKDSVESVCDFQELQNASAAFLHDVASPLSCLMAGVELLDQKLNEASELEAGEISQVVGMMSGSVSYLRALVEQWRSFSKIHTLMVGKCEAASAIGLAVNQVKKQVHSASILLILKSSREQLFIPGNDYAIARVVINLLTNAVEAVRPSTGCIQLTTSVTGKTFELTVADNGSGVPPVVQERIFLPRFSTKSTGQGLGLFISKKIIEAMGGTIKVQSPGILGGADFIVTLPLV